MQLWDVSVWIDERPDEQSQDILLETQAFVCKLIRNPETLKR